MFNLTHQERQVILFLIFIILFGTGINYLLKRYPSLEYITYEIERVNLNQANIPRLISLPGIGEKTAKEIIRYRRINGNFKKIEELKEIKGIGDSKYRLIKDHFFIE